MTDHPADDAIRALIRDVAIAAYEHAAEIVRMGLASGREMWEQRLTMAEELVELTMEAADETEEHPVHDLRSLAR